MSKLSRVLAASLLLGTLVSACAALPQPADYSFASGLTMAVVPAR